MIVIKLLATAFATLALTLASDSTVNASWSRLGDKRKPGLGTGSAWCSPKVRQCCLILERKPAFGRA